MLDIKVSINGDRVVLENLQGIAERLPEAVERGLTRSAVGIHEAAKRWLSGAGGQTRSYSRKWSAGGEVRQKKTYGAAAGGYPVPVRTGHLRQALDWLAPGQSKTGDTGTFVAGSGEVVIFDSASYADAVFHGKGSSASYGPRDALQDAFELFNHGDNIRRLISEEIQKEINSHGK